MAWAAGWHVALLTFLFRAWASMGVLSLQILPFLGLQEKN